MRNEKQTSEHCKEGLLEMTGAEWDAIHPDYKSIWDTERSEWPDWPAVRSRYMGKRTLLREGALYVEGLSFRIVPSINASSQACGRPLIRR